MGLCRTIGGISKTVPDAGTTGLAFVWMTMRHLAGTNKRECLPVGRKTPLLGVGSPFNEYTNFTHRVIGRLCCTDVKFVTFLLNVCDKQHPLSRPRRLLLRWQVLNKICGFLPNLDKTFLLRRQRVPLKIEMIISAKTD